MLIFGSSTELSWNADVQTNSLHFMVFLQTNAHFNKSISWADEPLNDAARNICWSSDLVIGAELFPVFVVYKNYVLTQMMLLIRFFWFFFFFFFSYSCDYIANLPPNSPPMKIGVEYSLRESQLSYCKQTAHLVWLASLIIHTLLNNNKKNKKTKTKTKIIYIFSNSNFSNSLQYLFLYYTYVAPHSSTFQNLVKM